MLRSMTGYGRGEAAFGEKTIATEIRSVNHRFLDSSVKISKAFPLVENETKKIIALHASRGKVDVSIQFNAQQNTEVNLQVDSARAKQVFKMLQQIKEDACVPGDINLLTLLSFRDVFFRENDENIDQESLWTAVKPSLEQALSALQDMQAAEGGEIARDMLQRLKIIEDAAKEIEARAPASLAARQLALKERVKTLCNGLTLDDQRMLQEISILADKSDITEELVRAKSHIRQFMQWMDSQEPVGRKLDFLMQEINREINTIGAKASDAEISMKVVIMKNELEKIREQIQNIM